MEVIRIRFEKLMNTIAISGVINKILSLPIFVILSRLSYGMYLIHYSIMQLRYLTTRSSIALTIVDQVSTFFIKIL